MLGGIAAETRKESGHAVKKRWQGPAVNSSTKAPSRKHLAFEWCVNMEWAERYADDSFTMSEPPASFNIATLVIEDADLPKSTTVPFRRQGTSVRPSAGVADVFASGVQAGGSNGGGTSGNADDARNAGPGSGVGGGEA